MQADHVPTKILSLLSLSTNLQQIIKIMHGLKIMIGFMDYLIVCNVLQIILHQSFQLDWYPSHQPKKLFSPESE